MAYVLERSDPLPEALRRVALEQIDIAMIAVEDAGCPAASRAEQVQSCCERLRGLLRLTEPALKASFKGEDESAHQAARRLAIHHDASVLLGTHRYISLGLSVDDTDGLALLTDSLQRAVTELEGSEVFLDALATAATDLEIVWQRAAGWCFEGDAGEIVSSGYALTYRRALDGQREAYAKQDAASFHRWRAQVKYHCLHAHLLESVWPLALAARVQAAGELAHSLGRANDLTVYADSLTCAGSTSELHNILIAKALLERNRLWAQVRSLGERLFHQPAKVMRNDMAQLWCLSEPVVAEDPGDTTVGP